MLLHHVKETFDRNVVDQPQTSQSIDLWIGISVSVKIIRRGSALAFGDKAFGYRCTKDI